MQQCKICNKTDVEFYKSNKSTCKKCLIEKEKLKYKDDPDPRKAASLKFQKEKLVRYRWLQAKARAIRKGIEFTITPEDIDLLLWRQDSKCFYTGMVFTNDGSGVTSMSIDRIDSSKGYTLDNIRLVCSLVNKMKSDRTEEGFLNCVRDIYHHMKLDRL